MSIETTAVSGLADREADAADAAFVEPFQFGIGHGRADDGDAARVRDAELLDRIDRDAVVGRVIARL